MVAATQRQSAKRRAIGFTGRKAGKEAVSRSADVVSHAPVRDTELAEQ